MEGRRVQSFLNIKVYLQVQADISNLAFETKTVYYIFYDLGICVFENFVGQSIHFSFHIFKICHSKL